MAFSRKQLAILAFPRSKYRALVCDRAIRSGKTSVMALSFVLWAMSEFDRQNFAICGKSVESAVRNVILPLIGVSYLPQHSFKLKYNTSKHCLTISRGRRVNYFYIYGGKDESSYTLIQGITLAGVMLDEVALMPRSFVEQATMRCSAAGLYDYDPINGRAIKIKELYYKGGSANRVDNEAYYKMLRKFIGDYSIEYLIIDPSASSMIETIQKYGEYMVVPADNDVLGGLQDVTKFMNTGFRYVSTSGSGYTDSPNHSRGVSLCFFT